MNRIEYQIIRSLMSRDKSFWRVIGDQDGTLKEYAHAIQKLKRSGVIEIKKEKLHLNRRDFKISKLPDLKCQKCSGYGILINDMFRKVWKRYTKLVRNRPPEISEFDQGWMGTEDVIRRLEFAYLRGDVEGKKILIIGDDDLLSIALGLSGLPSSVTVLEIDERINAFINNIAKEERLPIEAHTWDARWPLPSKYKGKFDTFITDPVETIPGIKIFLSRGIEGLKGENSAVYFGLTHLEAGLKKWKKIEEMLLKMNLVITDIIRDFAVYPDENNIDVYADYYEITKYAPSKVMDADWYKSSLIRAELIGKPKPLVKGEMKLKKSFFVDDEAWATAMKNQ